ncbi:alpha-isopropylmalate synthase regulatory domain-containing protein [Patescibacteria group bacterium]
MERKNEKKYELLFEHASSGTMAISTATVLLRVGTREIKHAELSEDGPVDAIFQAIKTASGADCTLINWSISNINIGSDSPGKCVVTLNCSNRIVHGMGRNKDILVASAEAYIDALNNLDRLIEAEIEEARKLEYPIDDHGQANLSK